MRKKDLKYSFSKFIVCSPYNRHALSTLHVLFHLIHTTTLLVRIIIIFTLELLKMRHRVFKELAQGHTQLVSIGTWT